MQVTNNMVAVVPTSGVCVEVSRVLPTQGNTRFAVAVQIGAVSPTITSVANQVEWSNDTDNWFAFGTGGVVTTTTFPNSVTVTNGGGTTPFLVGAFVRLRFTILGNPGDVATISADIDLMAS